MSNILGISAFYHDSAACLVVDGEIVAAAQEERFTRIKHDYNFPANATRYCLSEAGISPNDLAYGGFYDKPLLKFDRLLETYLDYAPAGFPSFLKAMPLWIKEGTNRCQACDLRFFLRVGKIATLNLMFVNDPLHEITITDVALIKGNFDADRVAMAAREIVQDDNLFVLRPQQFNGHTADVTRTTRDENSHA